MKGVKSVTVFAPATVANVAVGFDILGFPLMGLGERLRLEKISNSNLVVIEPIKNYPGISTDPMQNTAGRGLMQLMADKKLDFGFKISLEKSIPTGSGLGGSATSAVAAIVAANCFLKKKLSLQEQLHYALIGEEVASGSRHADNVAPCLLGGLRFVRCVEVSKETLTAKIKTPGDLRCVVILPDTTINTKGARKLLGETVSLKSAVEQSANLAGFVLGCISKDYVLIGNSLRDVLIETQRAHLIPGFYKFQTVALASGALGCSISGSGPAIFSLVKGQKMAEKVLKALRAVARAESIDLKGEWISAISPKGAAVVRSKK